MSEELTRKQILSKEYYKRNIDVIKAKGKAWREANRQKVRDIHRAWYNKSQKEKRIAQITDPVFIKKANRFKDKFMKTPEFKSANNAYLKSSVFKEDPIPFVETLEFRDLLREYLYGIDLSGYFPGEYPKYRNGEEEEYE